MPSWEDPSCLRVKEGHPEDEVGGEGEVGPTAKLSLRHTREFTHRVNQHTHSCIHSFMHSLTHSFAHPRNDSLTLIPCPFHFSQSRTQCFTLFHPLFTRAQQARRTAQHKSACEFCLCLWGAQNFCGASLHFLGDSAALAVLLSCLSG